MAKSRARYLAELLNSEGFVRPDASALAGVDGVIDLEVLPVLPNSQLEHSSVSIAGHTLSLGGSLTLDTADIGEHVSYKYYTDARARAAISASGDLSYNSTTGVVSFTERTDAEVRGLISVSGSLSYDSATGVVSYTTPTTIASLSNHSTTDLSEGTNLYYTTARFDTAFSGKSTTDLSEGTNLYYTTARFDTAFSGKSTTDLSEGTNLYYTTARANTDFDTRLATKSTTNLSEGTNLYYTDARARAAISVSGSLSYNSTTGVISYTTPTTIASLSNHDTDDLSEGTTNLYYTSARANADFDTRLATKSTTNLSEGTNLYYTDARVGSYLTSNSYATQTYVSTAISNLVDSAPATLDTLNELAAALGDDPNFATTVSTSIGTKWTQDNTKISNWDTAYSWGNHASAGYLTSFDITTQTDSKYLRADTADQMQYNTTSGEMLTFVNATSGGKIQLGFQQNDTDGMHHRLYLKTWKGSTTASGNVDFIVRGSGGSTTSDVFALRSSDNNLSWRSNTIWNAGNDGSGSGLDADLLDGQHGSYYAPVSSLGNYLPLSGGVMTGSIKNNTDGAVIIESNTSEANNWLWKEAVKQWGIYYFNKGSQAGATVGGYTTVGAEVFFTGSVGNGPAMPSTWTGYQSGSILNVMLSPYNGYIYSSSTVYAGSSMVVAGNSVWHAGNDGSGSGLDADLLDGQHGSYYAPVSSLGNYLPLSGGTLTGGLTGTTANFSGKVDFQGDAAIEGGSGYGVFKGYTGNNNHLITSRGIITGSTSSPSIIGGHETTFVEYCNTDSSGFVFKRSDTGTYTEIARVTRTGITSLGNTVWHAGNDGSGSGLDADLLDGIDSSRIVYGSNANKTNNTSSASANLPSGFYDQYQGDMPTATYYSYLNIRHTNVNNHHGAQIAVSFYSPDLYTRHYQGGDSSGNGSFSAWDKHWRAGNDGSGSGLDADLLDGIDSGSFVRSDANDTLSAQYTFTKTDDHAIKVGTIRGTAVGSQTGEYIHMYERVHIGGPNGWGASNAAAPSYGLSTYGGANLATTTGSVTIGGNTAWHAGNDGSGSGLDADLLDGIQGSAFLRTDIAQSPANFISLRAGGNHLGNHEFAANTNQTSYSNSSIELREANYGGNSSYSAPRISFHWGGVVASSIAINTAGDILIQDNPGTGYENLWAANIYSNSNLVWHAGNDGSGSGLDADLLDGQHGSYYLPTDTARSNISASSWAGGNGYHGYTYSGGNWRFGFSSTSGVVDVYADGNFYATDSSHLVLHAGNYNSYSPSLSGNGASGTWGINITGSAGSAGNATTVSSLTNANCAPAVDYTTPSDASGYTWIRIPFASGDSFNSGQHQVEFYISRAIFFNGSNPYGGCTAKFTAQGREWHSGQEMLVVQYGEHGSNNSFGQGYYITNARVADQAGSGYWIYLRVRAGITYRFREALHGGAGINFGAIEGTSDPGSSQPIRYGLNLISTAGTANYFYNGNAAWHAGNDGSGSGLDADMVDGIQGSNIAQLNANQTFASNTYKYFSVDRNGYCGATNTANLQAHSNNNNSAFMSFHKGGHYAVNMGLDADNVMRIGGWSAAANRWSLDMSGNMTAAGNVTAYSDIRLKENIKVIPDALEKVQKIRGVTFTRNDQEDKEKLHTGVIAQEVEAVLPEVISEDNLGIKNVAYGNMVGLLIEAIKELKAEVEDLKSQLKEK